MFYFSSFGESRGEERERIRGRKGKEGGRAGAKG
jgi:hypothetical protein